MARWMRFLPAAAAVLTAMPVVAQTTQKAPAPATAPPPPDVSQRGGEPLVERRIIEDDSVRIEELRVRGQTQRIVVRSKLGSARPYEIVPTPAGRDLSQDKGASGQRVWHILSF